MIVSQVTPPDGPSAKAGLKANDIITAINGQSIKDGDDLLSHVSDAPVGSTLTLSVDRDTKKMEFKVVTQDRKVLFKSEKDIVGENFGDEVAKPEPAAKVKFGITPRELSDAERNLTPDKRGVMVSTVEDGSFAEDIEMEAGDLIIAINRHPVSSVDDLKRIAGSLKSGDAVAFLIVRPPARGPSGAGAGFRPPGGGDRGHRSRGSVADLLLRQAPVILKIPGQDRLQGPVTPGWPVCFHPDMLGAPCAL